MRCQFCKKKTIVEQECKCLKKFCLNCLPYFAHNCPFNYRKKKQDNLAEENEKIIAAKVIEI